MIYSCYQGFLENELNGYNTHASHNDKIYIYRKYTYITLESHILSWHTLMQVFQKVSIEYILAISVIKVQKSVKRWPSIVQSTNRQI